MDIIAIKEYKNIIMFTQAYKKVKENPVILAAVASVAIAILATILTSSFTTKKTCGSDQCSAGTANHRELAVQRVLCSFP